MIFGYGAHEVPLALWLFTITMARDRVPPLLATGNWKLATVRAGGYTIRTLRSTHLLLLGAGGWPLEALTGNWRLFGRADTRSAPYAARICFCWRLGACRWKLSLATGDWQLIT